MRYLDPVPELLGEPVLLPVLGHAPRHLLLQHLHHVHHLDAAVDGGVIQLGQFSSSLSTLNSHCHLH